MLVVISNGVFATGIDFFTYLSHFAVDIGGKLVNFLTNKFGYLNFIIVFKEFMILFLSRFTFSLVFNFLV